ncbi:MAG: ATP-binding cassette domain-containing protein [Acutalibacteraceae bacterium]
MIHCSNLTKDYKSFKKTGWLKLRRSKSAEVFRAVDNITFDIGAGEVVGYIGPNGAGKSTTIKMMCGILTPTSGELTVNGLVPYKNRQKNARQIGVIFGQKSQLWWDLPITSSLKLYQKMYEIPDDVYHERYMQLCDMLELDEFADRPVRTLSLGQRMRGELAAAVLHRPPVLILDEPTIGMDVVVKERIRAFLKELNRAYGTTILLTTHDMTDIEKVCARAIMINKGKKLFDGTLEALRQNSRSDSRVTVRLEKAVPPAVEARLRGLEKPEAGTYIFRLSHTDEENRLLSEVLENNRVLDMYIAEPTLEEEVARYLGKGETQ